MWDTVEEGRGVPTLRVPHVLLTVEEVERACRWHLGQETFVFDIETTSLDTPTNDVLWIGLGGHGRVDLIPTGHPKGIVLEHEHEIETPAYFFYPEDDPRRLTPIKGEPSFKKVKHKVPTVYAEPPEQLMVHEVLEILRPLMFSDRGKLGHGVKFDLKSISKYYAGEIPPGPYHDTVILRHVLNEELMTYQLKPLVGDWFQVPAAKRSVWYPNMGKAGIENFGLDEVARYLAKDLRYCWLMFHHHYPKLKLKDLQQVYDFEMDMYAPLMAMEQHGFPVDLEAMEVVREKLMDDLHEVEQQSYAIAGDEFSLSDNDAKRWILFGEAQKNRDGTNKPEYGKAKNVLKSQGLRPRGRTPKENLPQVTKGVLESYEFTDPQARLFLEWSRLDKLRGTFIDGLIPKLQHVNGLPTVHTNYKQHGTKTGRFSSEIPNLQQLPAKDQTIRKLFVAGPRKVLLVADYDQIELRAAAFLSGDRNMTGVFMRGEDIHRQAAAAMYLIKLAEVTDDQRGVGKTQNFAVLYGAGDAKIAYVAQCSMDRAADLIEGYYQAFPQIRTWKARELQRARQRGDRANPLSDPPRVVIPPYGRLRRLPDLFVMDGMRDENGDNISWRRFRAERQAINAIVQGFASYITKLAMRDLHQRLPEGSCMVAQVHDEIVVLADEDVAAEAKAVMVVTMEGVLDPFTGAPILGDIPLVVSAHPGYSWAEAKAAGK